MVNTVLVSISSKECQAVVEAVVQLDRAARDIDGGDTGYEPDELRAMGTKLADAIYEWSKVQLKESMNIEQLDAISVLVRNLERNVANEMSDREDFRTYHEEMAIKAADDMRDD